MTSLSNEEDFIVSFIQSEKLQSRLVLNNLSDLQRYFQSITTMIAGDEKRRLYMFWCDRHEETTRILESYEDFAVDVSYYVNRKLFMFDELSGDEDAFCIKIMLIIYHYFVVSRETMISVDTSVFLPFLYYIEQRIVPKVFDCAKKLKKEAENGQLNEFETGIEDLEPWQKIILHLYSELQSEIFSYHNEDPDMDVYYNSCFVMLTLLKYFKEKKDKYLKENHGQYWKKENQSLISANMSFWTPFLKELFTCNTDELQKLKRLFSVCMPNYLEYLHRITGLTFDDDGEDLKADLVKFLTLSKFANMRNEWWNHCVSIMKEDYEEVKEMEDMSFITNEQSKNFGEYVYVIKNKIMNTLGFVVADQQFEEGDEDELRNGTSLRVSLLIYFKDFIIGSMQKIENETTTEKLLRGTANNIAITTVCMDLDVLDEIPSQFKTLALSIHEIWKTTLLSSNTYARVTVNNSLSNFISRNSCPDDLLETIINAQHVNITNFKEYSELLANTANCFPPPFEMEESLLERFKQLIISLFETIIIRDDMEYLSNMSYEEKIENHKENIVECFALLGTLHRYISNNDMVEKILSVSRKKIETVVGNNKLTEEDTLVCSITRLLSKIVKQTDRNLLEKLFEQLEYYPFLTKLIRSFISEKTVHLRADSSMFVIEPIAVLIGELYETRFLDNCPFDVNDVNENSETEAKKHILYDYISEILFEATIPNILWLEFLPLITSSPEIFQSIRQSSRTLTLILCNEIIRNGGERLLSRFLTRHFANISILLSNSQFYENRNIFGEVLVVVLVLMRHIAFPTAKIMSPYLPFLLEIPFSSYTFSNRRAQKHIILTCVFDLMSNWLWIIS